MTLVLMGSIAYARLKNVTQTLRIASIERRLEGTLIFFASSEILQQAAICWEPFRQESFSVLL